LRTGFTVHSSKYQIFRFSIINKSPDSCDIISAGGIFNRRSRAGTSYLLSRSSLNMWIISPTGTSLIQSLSNLIGIGHFSPRTSRICGSSFTYSPTNQSKGIYSMNNSLCWHIFG